MHNCVVIATTNCLCRTNFVSGQPQQWSVKMPKGKKRKINKDNLLNSLTIAVAKDQEHACRRPPTNKHRIHQPIILFTTFLSYDLRNISSACLPTEVVSQDRAILDFVKYCLLYLCSVPPSNCGCSCDLKVGGKSLKYFRFLLHNSDLTFL